MISSLAAMNLVNTSHLQLGTKALAIITTVLLLTKPVGNNHEPYVITTLSALLIAISSAAIIYVTESELRESERSPKMKLNRRAILQKVGSRLKQEGTRWVGAIAITTVLGVLLTCIFWQDLQAGEESLGATLRNAILMIAAAPAALTALWRSRVAEHQATTARNTLINDRYQRSAEMLGSEILPARLGGIYALQSLAQEDPNHYHFQIMQLFCSFVRNQKADNEGVEQTQEWAPQTKEDIQAIVTAIGGRSEAGLEIERDTGFKIDLRGANLAYINLSGANLRGANLSRSNLRNAIFFEPIPLTPDLAETIPPSETNKPPVIHLLASEPITPTFKGMEERRANLSLANLEQADLSESNLTGVDLSGASLVNAILSDSVIRYADMRKANLIGADLSRAFMSTTDLSGARLTGANMERATLSVTNLCGAELFSANLKKTDLATSILSKENGKYHAVGLTQAQLNEAIVGPASRPNLNGVVALDGKTQLVWQDSCANEHE